jgi:carbon-monoxide dehydrogenase large subunit
MTAYMGKAVKRLEDKPLMTGRGTFVDDLTFPDMLHAAVLRSPHAHARILSIDVSAARDMAGVVTVLTARDLKGVVADVPVVERQGAEYAKTPGHPALAEEKVFYVGQPVAIVAAQDGYRARDALDKVAVQYDPIPAIVDPHQAVQPDTPSLHTQMLTNTAMCARTGRGDVQAAFAEADQIIRGRFDIPRLSAVPLEGRGLIASYDQAGQTLTLRTSTQVPHRLRVHLAEVLRHPLEQIRIIAPDVGGGFGQKTELWPEDVAISYLAMTLQRPIKWIEDRLENMVAYHGRGYSAEVEAAVNTDGVFLGIRFHMIADLGAYLLTFTAAPLVNVVKRVAGPYVIPTMEVECLGVLTNKPPTGPYRGAGGPESAYFMERTVDLVARTLNLDPVDIRKRNFIPADAFPYATATGITYDSGNFHTAFDRALELVEYDSWRRRQQTNNVRTPLIGVGVSTVVKGSGGVGESRTSSALIRIEPTGKVMVYTEISPHGQGTGTSFAQIASEVLGVSLRHVQICHGDTGMFASGLGTYASRGLTVGGSAVYMGLLEARRKVTRIAAHLLGCSPDDVVLHDGKAGDRYQPDQAIPWSEVISAAHEPERLPAGMQAGLEFPVRFTLPDNPYAFAAHVVVVEVDGETGAVRILRYIAVHDPGPLINPMLARGQIHGGIAQGIGQALSEAILYSDDGQPLNRSLMDYAVPRMGGVPTVIVDTFETPSSTNPLGIKGIGELPTVASPVAVANAVLDALAITPVDHIDIPLSPEKLWLALRKAEV